MSEQIVRQNQKLNNNFLERFKGKANKISKLGINAVLLGSSENVADFNNQFKSTPIPTPQKTQRKDSIVLKPLPTRSEMKSKSLEKSVLERKVQDPELKRYPSQKLPSLSLSSSKQLPTPKIVQRRGSLQQMLQKKLLLNEPEEIERTTAKNSSKYSQWKYPKKLDENALRFFEFTEGQRTHRSTKKFSNI